MFERFAIIAAPIIILALIIAGTANAILSRKQKWQPTKKRATITNGSNNGNSVKTTHNTRLGSKTRAEHSVLITSRAYKQTWRL